MANRPRKQPEPENKYTDKEYLTYEEAAAFIGIRRSTLYSIVAAMGVETKKFKLDKKRYLAIADVKRIKDIREKPWLAGEDTNTKNEKKPSLVA